MKLEDLKYEFPETPAFIHEMIVDEVNKQMKKETVVPYASHKQKKKSFRYFVAVAACAVVACATVAFAGVSLYHMYVEKKGSYGVKTMIGQEGDTPDERVLPTEIQEMEIRTNYIPGGMERVDEWRVEYTDAPNDGGISLFPLFLDGDAAAEGILDMNVVESEERTFGKYDGVYLRKNDLDTNDRTTFDQTIYLFCPQEYYVVIMNIGSNVSKEEAFKVAEGLELASTGNKIEASELYAWSNYVSPEEETAEAGFVYSMPEEELLVHGVGEDFTIRGSVENDNGDYCEAQIDVSVDQVLTADDLSLLEEEFIPEDWKGALDENGKLVPNNLSYVKKGDGIDTLDEVVKTEAVNQKLVVADVTYTNHEEFGINHLLYIGNMMLLRNDSGTYRIYVYGENPGDGYDYSTGDSVAHPTSMGYYSTVESYGNGGNYISHLDPGESIQVRMAWIVNEPDLENMFLDLNGTGGSYAFGEDTQKNGIVDIRQ